MHLASSIRLGLALASALAAPPPLPGGAAPAGGPDPAAPGPAPLVRLEAGSWLTFKGTLKVTTRRAGEEAEELAASLEVAYLGLEPPPSPGAPPGAGRRVLLLRDAESPDDERVAAAEAITLIAGPDLSLRPEFPVADRRRVSKILFTYLPLGIFPPLASADAARWRRPAAVPVLGAEPRDLTAEHRVEATAGGVRYTVTADPGQRTSFVEDRVEVPVEVREWVQVASIAPREGRLLGVESRLRAIVLDPGGSPAEVGVQIDLAAAERGRIEGARWERLRGEAELAREIEKALFVDFRTELAGSRAAAFAREHAASRLARFVDGLARQAEAAVPIANERKLYGKPAPDFALPDLEGKEAKLSALLPGKVTLLSFWSFG